MEFLIVAILLMVILAIRFLRKEFSKEKIAFLYLQFNVHLHDTFLYGCYHEDVEHQWISYSTFRKNKNGTNKLKYPKTKKIWIFHKVEICPRCNTLRLVNRF